VTSLIRRPRVNPLQQGSRQADIDALGLVKIRISRNQDRQRVAAIGEFNPEIAVRVLTDLGDIVGHGSIQF